MNTRITLQACQQHAEEKGGECLSLEYKNSLERMQWRCDQGHEWKASFDRIKQGSWCPVCAGNVPVSLQECQEFADEKGGECLSLEYKNSLERMQWRCDQGHEWKANFNRIKQGSWCPTCSSSGPT